MRLSYSRDIDVKYEVDVFVAGGGPAGISAAVTAAKKGKKVFLAEGHSCFGGMGTAGLIPLFMQFSDGEHFMAGGVGEEIYKKVLEAGGKLTCNGKYLSIPAEKLKRIYDNMIIAAGVDFTFQTNMLDAIVEDGNVKYAVCSAKSGVFAVKAKTFVDCTGDGDLSVMAGAEYEMGDEMGKMMPVTLCSLWANVDWGNVPAPGEVNFVELLENAFKENIFTVEDRHHSGMAQTGDSIASANIGHIFGVDGTDERSLTRAFLEGRSYLPEYEVFYRKFVPGYEKTELAWSGALMGVRETRRITGDYVMSYEDYLNRRQFEDQVGCYCYEIDIHPETDSKEDFEKSMKIYEKSKYNKGEFYGIPYGSLKVRGLENLLVAGRCVSSDKMVQSSIRPMAGCYITGQAAGMAAALAADIEGDIRGVDIKMLQDSLKEIGAFLG